MMEMSALLLNVLTAAFLSAALAVAFTGPPQCVFPTFVCGFATSLVHVWLPRIGFDAAGSTAIASAVAVLVGAAVTPKRFAAPVVVIAAIFPLSAGVALFDAIVDLLRVSDAQGTALQENVVSLTANMGRTFTTFASIALGLQVGLAIIRLFPSGRDA